MGGRLQSVDGSKTFSCDLKAANEKVLAGRQRHSCRRVLFASVFFEGTRE
jgi:hypothetical protein